MSRKTMLLTLLAAAGVTPGCGQRLIGRLPDAAPGDDAIVDADANVDAVDAPTDSSDDARDGSADLTADTDGGDDGPQVIPDLPQVCTAAGWCWTHPLPTGDRFVQAAGVGPDDTWLLGASGVILRRSGGVWSAIPPASQDAALSIWGTASNDVWLGTIFDAYHWNGQTWTRRTIPAASEQRATHAIWGCAPNDVWLVGVETFHWDGTQVSWSEMAREPGTFRTVWGSACNDVWVGTLYDLGGTGRIMHWDGSSWGRVADVPAEQIAGTASDDVWSLGQTQLYHWTAPDVGELVDSHTASLFAVGATAVGTMNSNDRIVSIRVRDRVTPLTAPVPAGISSLWARSETDIWGVGAEGVAVHWNGSTWTAELPAWALTRDDIIDVTGTGPTDLWATTSGGALLQGDGMKWKTALTAPQAGQRIYDVWARTADDVWVLGGDERVHRWNGKGWSTFNPPLPGTTTQEMRAISGTSPDDVWILRGMNTLLHSDGTDWTTRQTSLAQPVDIWEAGPDELWVAGADGVYRQRGPYGDKLRLPTEVGLGTPFTAVAGLSPTEVWVLSPSYLLQLDATGIELSIVTRSLNPTLVSIAPAAGGGVWLLSQNGDVSSIAEFYMAPPGQPTTAVVWSPAGLTDIWAAPDGTLWAGGAGGSLVRRLPAP
jgi:hypothetical protein